MIRLTLVGQTNITVAGVDLTIASADQWKSRLERAAHDLQVRVADSFAAQKVAGSRSLLRNKPSYDAAKVRQGFDPRRGHRTNQLQNALYTGRFYYVRVSKVVGEIVMSEPRLHGAVPHAEYYEEKKVRGGQILALARSWVATEEAKLRAWEAAKRKEYEATFGVNRAALSGAARRRIGGLIGRAVQGFRAPVAATPIAQDFSFVRGLSRGAKALINAAKKVR